MVLIYDTTRINAHDRRGEMEETRQLIEALKRYLRMYGITYLALGRRINLSEASVKRIFSAGTLTLRRLEQICRSLNLRVADLVRMMERQESATTTPTLEQEQALAADPTLLSYFYLLLHGATESEIRRDYEFEERQVQSLRKRLIAVGLAEELARGALKLRVGRQIVWRKAGPVRKAYERQVKGEFLRSEFVGNREFLGWQPAELTDASIEVLRRKLRQLYKDFLEIAELDADATQTRHSTALLLAFRPWVFSAVAARRRGRQHREP
jgi:DNA-binding Xre family transcriptional regulator